jgi:DNA polymerase III epsilon subunit family exonuclease
VDCDELTSATYAVLDVETTGLDPRDDRVVEVACLRVVCGRVIGRFASLVDPQRPIPARASAVHGIVDDDVAGAPTLAQLAPRIGAMTRDAVVVAHNAAFDVGFLPFVAERPILCTLKLARRLVDAPNYRNDTLRRVLSLRPDAPATRAHRAEADADVTAALLLELLRRYRRGPHEPTLSALLAMLARPVALERFAFGAFRDRSLRDVPTDYLRWILTVDFDNWPDVAHTARLELARRGALEPAARPARSA